jgi:putative ABC transport system substrate-binding protein
MRRRDFISFFAGTAAMWSFAARAQKSERVRQIGVLMARRIDDAEGQKQFAALRQGLVELGWSEGQTVHIEVRWTVGDPEEALKFARELVGLRPDVLVANATPSLVAMRQVATTIPVIFVSVADPVGQGFVPSLSRPGGIITGFGVEEASMGGKWLELLKEVAPSVKHVTNIYNPDTAPYAPMFLPSMQAAAPGMTVRLSTSAVRLPAEIDSVIVETSREPDGGLIVLPDSFMFGQRERLVALTAQQGLPAIYPLQAFVTSGGLIAYGIDRVDLFRRAASYVDRILRGALVAELPVQQPIKFELAVNLKTAKALKLVVPPMLLARAEAVIE